MPVKKKQSKLKRVLVALIPNTRPKQMLAFVLIFSILGGGYYFYKSSAAYYPSSTFTNHKVFNYYKTPTGVVTCVNTAFHTGYGPIVFNCLLEAATFNGSTTSFTSKIYVGNYIIGTKEFQKTGESATNYGFDARNQVFKCSNTDNYFSGQGFYTASTGWKFYGYIYSWYGSYVGKTAVLTYPGYKCTTSGTWQNIYTW